VKWLNRLDQWPGLRQMVMVESRREQKGQVSTERRDNGAENFSRLRRMVLNKLRAYEDPSGKKPSVRMKRKKCGWSFAYVLKVRMA
jgi:hypothetical protein